MPLNVEEWEQEIGDLLSAYSVFQSCRLVLDAAKQHDDQLTFVISDFSETIPDGLWHDIRQYQGVLQMQLESDPHSHRRENIVFTVHEPSERVIANLKHYAEMQMAVLQSRTWPPVLIMISLLLSLLWIGYAASLLHDHWHDTDEPWEGLVHWFIAMLSYLCPWCGGGSGSDAAGRMYAPV